MLLLFHVQRLMHLLFLRLRQSPPTGSAFHHTARLIVNVPVALVATAASSKPSTARCLPISHQICLTIKKLVFNLDLVSVASQRPSQRYCLAIGSEACRRSRCLVPNDSCVCRHSERPSIGNKKPEILSYRVYQVRPC